MEPYYIITAVSATNKHSSLFVKSVDYMQEPFLFVAS